MALIAWLDTRETNDTVLARRFDLAGTPLDPHPLRLGAMTPLYSNVVAGVVFDGQSFVVGWHTNGRIHLSRVSPAGVTLDPVDGVILAPAGAVHPRLAADGQNTWVAWEQQNAGTADVFAVRFSRAGVVLDASPLVHAGQTSNERSPSLCFDGTQVWAGWYSDVTAFRVSPLTSQGTLVTPGGLAVGGAPNEAEFVSGPTCAASWAPTFAQARLNRLGLDGGIDGTNVRGQPDLRLERDRAGPATLLARRAGSPQRPALRWRRGVPQRLLRRRGVLQRRVRRRNE